MTLEEVMRKAVAAGDYEAVDYLVGLIVTAVHKAGYEKGQRDMESRLVSQRNDEGGGGNVCS